MQEPKKKGGQIELPLVLKEGKKNLERIIK